MQYIVSTHSSHIVSESDFDDIKYLKIVHNSVVARNLKSLEKEYETDGEEQNYKFLKQYLTLHRAELFFADKTVFIEGDTERILLPAMMKKIDQDNPDNPLLSQNISIVETGAHSHIFEKFIDFIGVKSLIITDIDSAHKVPKIDKDGNIEKKDDGTKKMIVNKCPIVNGEITTNSSLKYFYESNKLEDFKDKVIAEMILQKNTSTKKWKKKDNGFLVCVYQTKEKNSAGEEYYARSFEDSFFHLNRQFISDNKDGFKSLKNIRDFDDASKGSYDLAENCVAKKPPFAIEVLINSKTDGATKKDFSNWQIPDYIYQGLLWLKKD